MKPGILLLLFTSILASCKKDKAPSTISYTLVNKSVVLTDISSLAADINNDGTPDLSLYVQLVGNSSGDHMYLGVNPLNGARAITNPPDDDLFNNSGWVVAQPAGSKISGSLKTNEVWNPDFGVFAIKHVGNTSTTYEGAWGNETEQIMAVRLSVNTKIFYGWARLKYTRSENKLTLVDQAFNRAVEKEIGAGEGR